MPQAQVSNEEIFRRGQEIYDGQIAPMVETDENIGKIVAIDINSSDYEIDPDGLAASRRLRLRHPDAIVLGLRIGYDSVEAFGGPHSSA